MAGSTAVAVKYVTRQSPKELRRFAHEIGILKSLRHTNIVQVPLGTMPSFAFVAHMTWIPNGCLHNAVPGCVSGS